VARNRTLPLNGRSLSAALLLVLASGALAYGALSSERRVDAPGATAASDKDSPRLEARGRVTGLYPGATKRMMVRVQNGYADPVRLTSVRTSVRDAGAECAAENIAVSPRTHARRLIPPGRSRGLWVPVRMIPGAAEACQGARFPLRFRVRGKVL
jgi:hypothetical protein